MSTSKRVVKNTFYLYGKIAITSVCLIFSTRYILQGLGIDDFGVFNLTCSTIGLLSFLNESMTAATQRFLSYAEGKGDLSQSIKIFNSSYVVHIGIALFIALAFIVLKPLVFGDYLIIPKDRLVSAQVVYYFTIFTTALSMMTVPYNAVLVAHENMLYYSIMGSLDGILKVVASIALFYIPVDKLILYGVFLFVIGLLNFVICRVYCSCKYKECKINFRKHVDFKVIRQMFMFAVWQLTYSASSILSIQGMGLILNSFFGTIMNAAQGISKQVCGQMMTLSGTMMNALNPVIVKYAGSKNQSGMIYAVMVGSKLAYFLAIVVALPILFELSYLLRLWLTEVPDYAILFCRYEVAQQIIASVTVALVTMVSGNGDIRGFQLFSSLTYILRLPSIYILLRFFRNPEYAYWVTTIAVIALCIGRVYYAHVKCQLPVVYFLSRVVMPCVVVSMFVCLALSLIVISLEPSFVRLMVSVTVSTLTLIVSIFCFALDKEEKEMVKSVLLQLKQKISRI
jgi:Na+-driven multidrug efflux pump